MTSSFVAISRSRRLGAVNTCGRGLCQLVKSVGDRTPTASLRVDLASREVQSKIREGAAPLRVYTCLLAERVVSTYGGAGPVCDLGCGTGAHHRFFRAADLQRLYVGADVRPDPHWLGSDVSADGLACRFTQMSMEHLGLASHRFAFTFSSSTLEHVTDPQQTIQELARTIRPGAYGVHVVPGVWSLFLYLFHGSRRFSRRALVALFEEAGLEVVRIWSLGGVGSFLLRCCAPTRNAFASPCGSTAGSRTCLSAMGSWSASHNPCFPMPLRAVVQRIIPGRVRHRLGRWRGRRPHA